jgi:acyl-CoA reductase-like NAD-dependent aldehyde dehydrogenase
MVVEHRVPTGVEISTRRADGVVANVATSSWSFIPCMPLAYMLLPGNAVVLRIPDGEDVAPLLVDTFREALLEGGFEADVLLGTRGSTRTVVPLFAGSPDVDTIVFWGNYDTGRAVAEQAAAAGKKYLLELEGSDYMVVWRDGDVARASESASYAWFRSTEPCVAPKHVLTHPDVHEAFVAAFVDRLPSWARTVEHDPVHGLMTPVRRTEDYDAALGELADIGRIRAGGHRMSADGTRDDTGPYVAPTIVDVDAAACSGRRLRVLDTEIGYPLIPVVRFAGDDASVAEDMCRMLDASPFGMRASVWTRDAEAVSTFASRVAGVGTLKFNTLHMTPHEYGSIWGGPKRTGGPFGEHNHFWEKTSRRQLIACDSPETAEGVRAGLGAVR